MKFEVVEDKYRHHSRHEVKLPIRSTRNSAAYDFYIYEEYLLEPGDTHLFWTDIKWKSEDTDKVLLLSMRSSLAKNGIILANAPGVVDQDYYGNDNNDGNIGFLVINVSRGRYRLQDGDRIGQGRIAKYYTVDDEITREENRIGGFGSTGE